MLLHILNYFLQSLVTIHGFIDYFVYILKFEIIFEYDAYCIDVELFVIDYQYFHLLLSHLINLPFLMNQIIQWTDTFNHIICINSRAIATNFKTCLRAPSILNSIINFQIFGVQILNIFNPPVHYCGWHPFEEQVLVVYFVVVLDYNALNALVKGTDFFFKQI